MLQMAYLYHLIALCTFSCVVTMLQMAYLYHLIALCTFSPKLDCFDYNILVKNLTLVDSVFKEVIVFKLNLKPELQQQFILFIYLLD